MADRKLIVHVLGDDDSFRKAMNRSTQSANKFGVAIAKVEKKAGTVQGLLAGRGLAGTFAGAAAAAATIKFVRDSITASQEAQVVLGQTQKALENAGFSWEQYGDQVEGAADRISVATAFDDEDVLRSAQVLVRSSRDVDEALRRVGLAADVARAREQDLAFGTNVVNKAALGQIGALRRLGIQIDNNATSTEALRLLQEKFGGSAATFADSSAASTQRLAVATENLKESLGNLLLPAVSRVAEELTTAAVAADKLVENLDRLADVKIPKINIPIVGEFGGGKATDFLQKVLGDFTPKDILIPVRIVRAFTGGDDPSDPENILPAVRSSDSAATAVENAGRAARKSGQGFRDFLAALNAIISPTLTAVAAAKKHAAALDEFERATDTAALAIDQVSLALERAQATPTLKDDIAAQQAIGKALVAQEKAIRAKIALEKDNIGFQQELVSNQNAQIQNENALAAAVAQRASNQKEAAREAARVAKEQADAAAAAARSAEQARQFRSLGLSAEGDKPIPTIDNLTKQLNQLDTKIAGGNNQRLLNAIRKVLTDPLRKATEETRTAIRDMFSTIRGELDDGLKGPLTATSGLATKKIIEGLGLDAATANEIRSRLSGFNTAGRALTTAVPAGLTGVGAGANIDTGSIVVESTVILDGEAVGRSVTRHQQKARRRNPPARRGPFRGV